MILFLLIIFIVILLLIVFLYSVGKRVKVSEQDFIDMMAKRCEDDRIRVLQERKRRQSTPRVPRVRKDR